MTIHRLAILLAAFELSYASCDAHADCPTAEVVRANATIATVQARLQASLDPPSKTRALRLVLSTALDRKQSALALCDDDPSKASPFEPSDADPFEDVGDDFELAYAVTVEMVGAADWGRP
jgi:hypothetical protein